jgi:hypothetical protein
MSAVYAKVVAMDIAENRRKALNDMTNTLLQGFCTYLKTMYPFDYTPPSDGRFIAENIKALVTTMKAIKTRASRATREPVAPRAPRAPRASRETEETKETKGRSHSPTISVLKSAYLAIVHVKEGDVNLTTKDSIKMGIARAMGKQGTAPTTSGRTAPTTSGRTAPSASGRSKGVQVPKVSGESVMISMMDRATVADTACSGMRRY